MLGNIFGFGGRTGRLGYFCIGLIQAVFLLIVIGVTIAMKPKTGGAEAATPSVASLAVLSLAILLVAWTGLAANARRLRDMGWNVILGMIGVTVLPFVGALLFFWPGDGGSDFDASVFSDDRDEPKKPKGAGRAKAELEPDRLAWMRPAAKAATPAPIPYKPPQPAYAPNDARPVFGLRR